MNYVEKQKDTRQQQTETMAICEQLRNKVRSRVQECKSARVQECKSARVQECKSARVQGCKAIKVVV